MPTQDCLAAAVARNTIYLYMGYWFLNMGLDMGLDEACSV
jgi:hypothetical protein